MTVGTILIIILVLLLIGALPHWPYASGPNYPGYYPSGIVGVILIVVIILLLTGRL
jgi:uncharacterized protein DUF3309